MEINILDALTASKIAAGEVVEKPFNVVKELLENALDSGASKITIDIYDGGAERIRVTDNGKGIAFDELHLAVERFATSKTHAIEDVYNVSTYGFRGEALAAISAVSKFSIKSFRSGESGGELFSNYGNKSSVTPAAISIGTQVTVDNLFDNIPVRKKYLKSKRSNEGEILKFIKQMAIFNAGIEIILNFDDKEVFRTFPKDTALIIAKKVFGEDNMGVAEEAFPIAVITVCASKPTVQRGRKDGIYVGVNGRVVRDVALLQAVIQAYHRLLPANMYPLAAVDIRIEPSFVDVNVHPTKSEVRFEKPSQLFSYVKTVTEKVLNSFNFNSYANSYYEDISSRIEHSRKLEENRPSANFEKIAPKSVAQSVEVPMRIVHRQKIEQALNIPDIMGDSAVEEAIAESDIEPIIAPVVMNNKSSGMKVLAQLANMYILCEDEVGGLHIFDQHIVHERILYEKYISNMAEVPSITLFEPLLITVQNDELETLMAFGDDFSRFGYSYEPFGSNHVKITRVPVDIIKKDIKDEFTSVMHSIMGVKRGSGQDFAALTMACKNAVKAGDSMNLPDMQYLVDTLFTTKNPYTCPHGRPIIFSLPATAIAKKFHR